MSGVAPITLPPLALPPATVAAAPASAAAATGTPPSTPTVTVVSGAAQALAALANGAALSGTIAPSSGGGAITLLTALGTLSLTAALPLPAGTSLTLQAQATNASVATILAVNGNPPLAAPTATPAATAITPPAAPVVIDVGTTVAATVVTPNAPPSTAPPLVPLLAVAIAPSTEPPSAGPLDSVTIAAVAPVAVAASAPTTTESEGSPMPLALQGGAAAVPTGTAMPATARPPFPGRQLALRVLAVQLIALGGETSAPRPPPALTGIIRDPATRGAAPVLDTPTADTPIVDTSTGPLLLRGAPALPAGTRVALRLLPDAPAAAELTVLPEPATPGEKAVTAPPPSTEVEPLPTAVETPPHGQAPDASAPERPASPAAPLATSTGEPDAPPAAAPTEPLVARVTLASPQAPGKPAEQILTGAVLPDTSGGHAPLLVETSLGVLALSPRLAVPVGGLLLLAAQDVEAPLLGLVDDTAAGPAKGWSSLASALPALAHAAPALAAQLRADLTPQAGGDRLAATFLFLIDALRGPAGPPWPGELVAKALAAAGSNNDKTKLVDDLDEARRIAAAPATGDWQVFMLPLVEGPAVRPLRLYLKRREKSRRNAAGESARFVLEFELSRLGALQLDGFVRPRRFDLLLRTKAPMGAALESAVERIFHDRIAAAGLGGTIDFSTATRFDIAPLDGMRGHVGLAV